jgi:3-oxoacyl-(acyl-carrier-protein) synthase
MSTDIYLTCGLVRCTQEIQAIRDIAFPTSVHRFPETYRHAHMGLVAPVQRLIDDLIKEAIQTLTFESQSLASRQALLLAAGNTLYAGTQIQKTQAGGSLDFAMRSRLLQTTQMQAGKVAQILNATGHIGTDSSACASSMKSLMDAVALIRLHDFQSVAIVAAEDQVSLGILEFFGGMGICLSQHDLDQGKHPSAFDRNNHGFLIGQGAAFAMLESADSMRINHRRPLARLLSAVTTGESFLNPVGQDPQGSGYIRAIEWALRQAKIKPKQIDLVKTHGTGTPLNNRSEANALRSIFGDQFLATAYKPRIGHTFGVSGLLESLLAIQDAHNGLVRGIAKRTEQDDVFLSQDRALRPKNILSLSAGMGNVYGAAIWEVLYP